jgi:hypothetical protein
MPDIEMRPDVSQKMTQALNETMLNNNIDPGAFRTPKYFVYIYNVANREFERRLPPQIPRLILKACPPDQEYIQVAKLAEPFEQADRDIDTGEVRIRFHSAKAIAQDIVCCGAADMDAAAPDAVAAGVDYRAKGLFWSLNNPPTAEEVAKANKRVEEFFRARLSRNTALEYTNPKELMERLGEDDHLAADYFGEEYSWHKQRVKKVTAAAKVECPYCGDQIKPGVAFHKGEDGELCILDWKRAYEAGKVTLKQVPEAKQWEGFKAPVTVGH